MTVREYIEDNPSVTIAKVTAFGKGEIPIAEAMDMAVFVSSHNHPEDHSIVELTVC